MRALTALAVALAMSVTLIWREAPGREPDGPLTVARAWPAARIVDMPGTLADGTPYTPLHHLDAGTSVGTAPTADRQAIRLLLRGPDGAVRQLHAVAEPGNPQFGGFTATADDLVWAQTTTGADGRGQTQLWRAAWRSGTAPGAPLTGETGDAVFFNSQYDLQIADGRVHWVAAARTTTPVTELRSVPLTGGPVAIERLEGAFALTSRPWLVTAGSGQTGPVQLREGATGRAVDVPAQPTELVACSPSWCRVLVLATVTGPVRIDLMRPDGTDRRQVASGLVSASISDVAVLDRFEVLTMAGQDGSATSSQRLMLYDATSQRTVTVATGVGVVLCRAGVLWWSTGDNEALTWHALDLRTLT